MPKCRGNDPTCPCQDGDACHYRDHGDSPAMPTRDERERVEPDGTLLGVHRVLRFFVQAGWFDGPDPA